MSEFLHNLMLGAQVAYSLQGLLMIIIGVVLGILVGATPGLSPAMGVALLVPFCYGMNPAYAFFLFVAVYQAANYGGSITAIAINAPGTPSASVTAIDGYKLTEQGKPGLALGMAVFSSAMGGFLGTLVLIFLTIPLSNVALKFGPAEYFSLAVFGLTTVSALGGDNRIKAFVACVLGLLLSTVGLDPVTGIDRFTFGIVELYDGFALIPGMIGLFALGEIFFSLEKLKSEASAEVSVFSNKLPGLKELGSVKATILRSSLLGTLIGIVPGAGATIATFISYGEARRRSRRPEEFGKGSLEGVAAAEAANSSSVGGALVPLLALGIPGSATSAVLIGALIMHGLVPGPKLFDKTPEVGYGIFAALLAANVLILVLGTLGNKLWMNVIKVPKGILVPLIIAVSVVGSFSVKNSMFDVWVCLGFGLLGWSLKRNGFPTAPVVLGLVLGGLIENSLGQAMIMGGPIMLIKKPISLTLLILAALVITKPRPGTRGQTFKL